MTVRALIPLLALLLPLSLARPVPAQHGPPAPEPGCHVALSAAPLPIGEKDHFARLGGLARGAAVGIASSLLATATGGVVDLQSGGAPPELYKDPLKKHRHKLRDRASRIKLRVAARVASDGVIVSSRIDRARGKGTLHLAYFEREDCRRIHPFRQLAYELWGEWKLSVSFDDSGTYSASSQWLRDRGSAGSIEAEGVDPETLAYQRALRHESGPSIWKRLGFGAPLSGARSIGTLYRFDSEDMAALREGRMTLVLHVTRKRDAMYESVGIPMRVALPDGEELLDLEVIEDRSGPR